MCAGPINQIKPTLSSYIPSLLSTAAGVMAFVVLHFSGAMGAAAAYGFSATAIIALTGLPLLAGVLGALLLLSKSAKEIASIQQNTRAKPYSDVGREALEVAEQRLAKYSRNTPWWRSLPFFSKELIWPRLRPPVNKGIYELTYLYKDICRSLNPNLSGEAAIEALDLLIKIAYAISALTLDDLEPFKAELQAEWTNTQMLTDQGFYQYKTFYVLPTVYHNAKNTPVVREISGSFYESGTRPGQWRALYNDYCDRVRAYASEEDLLRSDARHVNWTQKDQDMENFRLFPGTQPT